MPPNEQPPAPSSVGRFILGAAAASALVATVYAPGLIMPRPVGTGEIYARVLVVVPVYAALGLVTFVLFMLAFRGRAPPPRTHVPWPDLWPPLASLVRRWPVVTLCLSATAPWFEEPAAPIEALAGASLLRAVLALQVRAMPESGRGDIPRTILAVIATLDCARRPGLLLTALVAFAMLPSRTTAGTGWRFAGVTAIAVAAGQTPALAACSLAMLAAAFAVDPRDADAPLGRSAAIGAAVGAALSNVSSFGAADLLLRTAAAGLGVVAVLDAARRRRSVGEWFGSLLVAAVVAVAVGVPALHHYSALATEVVLSLGEPRPSSPAFPVHFVVAVGAACLVAISREHAPAWAGLLAGSLPWVFALSSWLGTTFSNAASLGRRSPSVETRGATRQHAPLVMVGVAAFDGVGAWAHCDDPRSLPRSNATRQPT